MNKILDNCRLPNCFPVAYDDDSFSSLYEHFTNYIGNQLDYVEGGDIQSYNNNQQIVVLNDNKFPPPPAGVGYTITGNNVPPNTRVTSYRSGTSKPSSAFQVIFMDLNNPVNGTGSPVFYNPSGASTIIALPAPAPPSTMSPAAPTIPPPAPIMTPPSPPTPSTPSPPPMLPMRQPNASMKLSTNSEATPTSLSNPGPISMTIGPPTMPETPPMSDGFLPSPIPSEEGYVTSENSGLFSKYSLIIDGVTTVIIISIITGIIAYFMMGSKSSNDSTDT